MATTTTTAGDDDAADTVMSSEDSLALGDSYYVDEEYELALDMYAIALLKFDSNRNRNSSTTATTTNNDSLVYFRLHSHKAAALLKLQRLEEAALDCRTALEFIPSTNSSTSSTSTASTSASASSTTIREGETEACHYRLGCILMQLHDYQGAVKEFNAALQLATLNQRSTMMMMKYQPLIDKCTSTISASTSTSTSTSTSVNSSSSIVVNDDDTIMTATFQPETKKSNSNSNNNKATGNDQDNDDVDDDDVLIVEEVNQKAPSSPSSTSVIPTKTTTTTTTTRSASMKKPTMPKYQYYQSDTVMTICILESNITPQDIQVDMTPLTLTVILTKQGVEFTVISSQRQLFDTINVEKSKVLCKDTKVLIKLRKQDTGHEWHELFSKNTSNNKTSMMTDDDDDDDDKPSTNQNQDATSAAAAVPTIDTTTSTTARPYASTRDWNAIERNLEKDDADDKPQGEDAMNALFQQIYSKADDETKRAMIKSFQTSGGTVLSTNWNEVKEKDYEKEREAPKGMEWKTWEGDKA